MIFKRKGCYIMYKDCCPNIIDKTQISTDAYYYILPEGLKEKETSPGELQLVKFEKFLNIDDQSVYPEGIQIEGSLVSYDENGKPVSFLVPGIIMYQAIGHSTAIHTSEGPKFRVSYSEKNGAVSYRFCSKEELKGKYTMKYIFKVSKTIQISLNLSGDVYFDSKEDGEKYLRALRFYGGELTAEGIRVVFNQKCIHYYNYNVFIKGKPFDCPDYSKFFEMLCNAYPVKGVNMYERSFALYSDWVEFVQL